MLYQMREGNRKASKGLIKQKRTMHSGRKFNFICVRLASPGRPRGAHSGEPLF